MVSLNSRSQAAFEVTDLTRGTVFLGAVVELIGLFGPQILDPGAVLREDPRPSPGP